MGLIAVETPGKPLFAEVERKQPKMTDIVNDAKIRIVESTISSKVPNTTFDIDIAADHSVTDKTEDFDYLWKIARPFTQDPEFSLFMSAATNQQDHAGVSGITFLPMIDLNPTDMTCILSTLHFVKDLAAKREVTPVLTFDQPLYWKAQAILSQTDDRLLQNIVLRLGGFHLI